MKNINKEEKRNSFHGLQKMENRYKSGFFTAFVAVKNGVPDGSGGECGQAGLVWVVGKH